MIHKIWDNDQQKLLKTKKQSFTNYSVSAVQVVYQITSTNIYDQRK